MINILIADDHDIFTDALVALLTDTGEISVVATASSGAEAVRLAEEHPGLALLVLDVSMPGMDGIEALQELRRRKCLIPVLMLTQEASAATIARAMKAGASGYVLKTSGRDEFLEAIRSVAAGGEHLSTEAKEVLLTTLTGRPHVGGAPKLTRRELEVLRLIASGITTNAIAEKLFISPHTVETHRRNLLQKLELKNAAALVRYAMERGLVDE